VSRSDLPWRSTPRDPHRQVPTGLSSRHFVAIRRALIPASCGDYQAKRLDGHRLGLRRLDVRRHLPAPGQPAPRRSGPPWGHGLATNCDREVTEAAWTQLHCGEHHERGQTSRYCRQAMPGFSRCQPDVTECHQPRSRLGCREQPTRQPRRCCVYDRGPTFSS